MTNESVSRTVVRSSGGPGCLISLLWFLFIGWWAGGIAITIAWILNVTIIGLPLGMSILNNIPKVIALQAPEKTLTIASDGTITEQSVAQHNILVRAAFFILIGWWWSAVWLAVAFAIACTLIGLPVSFWMFRRTPAMTTLRRY